MKIINYYLNVIQYLIIQIIAISFPFLSVLKDNNTTKRETPQPKIYSNVKPTTVAKSQLSNFTEVSTCFGIHFQNNIKKVFYDNFFFLFV